MASAQDTKQKLARLVELLGEESVRCNNSAAPCQPLLFNLPSQHVDAMRGPIAAHRRLRSGASSNAARAKATMYTARIVPSRKLTQSAASARRVVRKATMGVEESAKSCLDDGCSIDTVESLIEELKEESAELALRQQQILLLIGQLQVLNKDPVANKEQLANAVTVAARNFGVVEGYDFPGEPLGFSMPPTKPVRAKDAQMSAARRTSMPKMAVEDAAQSCLDDGCSIDTVESLIEQLKEEYAAVSLRQQQILVLIGALQVLNKAPEANKDEIAKVVGGVSRNFGTVEGYDFPGEPLGFSGEIGSGPVKGKAAV